MHNYTIAMFSQFGLTVGILDVENTFSNLIAANNVNVDAITLGICDADKNIDPIAMADMSSSLSHIIVLNPIVMARGPQGQGILQPLIPMVDIKKEQRPMAISAANLSFISAREVAAPYFEATSSISLAGTNNFSGFAKA